MRLAGLSEFWCWCEHKTELGEIADEADFVKRLLLLRLPLILKHFDQQMEEQRAWEKVERNEATELPAFVPIPSTRCKCKHGHVEVPTNTPQASFKPDFSW